MSETSTVRSRTALAAAACALLLGLGACASDDAGPSEGAAVGHHDRVVGGAGRALLGLDGDAQVGGRALGRGVRRRGGSG
ncbi:hypothetical protein NBM05_09700, partial [Rothia sp. AR01]|nr:hypothetical protein [Rothia santali]